MKRNTRLEKLVGKEYIYKQDNIKIKDYFEVAEENAVRIITDKKPILIKYDELDEFMEALLPVASEATSAVVTVFKESESSIMTLKDILLKNIEKVQTDPNYIPQAKVVNNSVNTLLRMVSLEVQVKKQIIKG